MANKTEKPIFGGHETFPFRYGWLKKGIEAAIKNRTIFSEEQALVELGVGKNMVRSIRHWCLVTNLLQENNEGGRVHPLIPTDLADKLANWDPYLEDIGSYWLIHWNLSTNKIRGLIWHILFAHYYEPEFTKHQFIAFCTRQLQKDNILTTPQTIEREIDCCLRTYVTSIRSQKGVFSEDSMDCPLVELDLLRFLSNDNMYRFNIGPKPTLPVHVFGYALLLFLEPFANTRRTIAVDDCLYYAGSPGQIFKLDENSLVTYLEELEVLTTGKLRLAESGGLRQLYLDEPLIHKAIEEGYNLLNSFYR